MSVDAGTLAETAPPLDKTCLGPLGCGHAHAPGAVGRCWEAQCDPRCPNPAHAVTAVKPR